MTSDPDDPRASLSPIERALRGSGGPVGGPAGAPGRAWSPAGGPGAPFNPLGTPAQPQAPIKRRMKVSVLEGTLLGIEVIPPDIDTFIELSKLVTKCQRQGAFCVSFWDLPGLQQVAALRDMEFESDPKLQEMVDKWNRWRMELSYIKGFANYDNPRVPGLDVDLYPFQRRCVNLIVKVPRLVIGDQMGLGKSIEVIGGLLEIRRLFAPALKTLILSPASVVGDWQKKFQRLTGITVPTACGDKEGRLQVYQEATEWLALSYDVFLRDYVEIAKHFHANSLISDECQRLVNRKCLATERLFDYVDLIDPKYRYFMSGSPVMNQPADLWPILRMVNQFLAGPAKAFEKRYLKMAPVYKKDKLTGKPKPLQIEYGSGEKKRVFMPMRVVGYQNLEELRDKLAPYLIRRLKKDVLSELPPKVHEVLEITLGKKERKVYEELQVDFAKSLAGIDEGNEEDQTTNFLQWFTKAQQICGSLEIVGAGKESSKLDELDQFLEDHTGDQKVLIFSRFKDMTDLVVDRFSKYDPIYLHGGVPQNDRQPLVDAFQEKDEHRIFVATLMAGGVGLTLTAAPLVARLDRWVAPAANEQAEDRSHRIGQKDTVVVTDFVVLDSVEERIIQIVEKKKKLIGELMVDEQVIKKLRLGKRKLLELL